MPDPITGASRPRDLSPPSEPRVPTRPRSTTAAARATAGFDRDLAAFVANARPTSDDVLYVPIHGGSASAEGTALRAVSRVTVLEPSTADVAVLGLSADMEARVAKVLASAIGGEREVLMGLARIWAEAERGGTIPSRLALSGHSGAGTQIFGDRFLQLVSVRALAHAMPRAAAQVEDIHLSACHTVNNAGSERLGWQSAFPNLKTIWAYNGAAPSPAGIHLQQWAIATRGRASTLPLSADLAAQNVAVWSREGGYRDGSPPIAVVRSSADQVLSRLDCFVRGEVAFSDPAARPIASDYRTMRALSSHHGALPEERAHAADVANVLLRVRYYERSVRKEFARAHADAITAGYAAAGRGVPDFGRLSRKEALAEIASFETGAPDHPEVNALRAELARLARLDVPESWCH